MNSTAHDMRKILTIYATALTFSSACFVSISHIFSKKLIWETMAPSPQRLVVNCYDQTKTNLIRTKGWLPPKLETS